MQIDDRLATVLRHRAAGERAARTQYRQLLDLLGARRTTGDESLLAAAWLRLAALGETIAVSDRATMIREPGLRFRNPELVMHLADDEPEIAAAALGVAQLSADDWEAVIPRLPVRARGFLRLRRDLPAPTMELLERLGVRDRGLPSPDLPVEPEVELDHGPARPIAANDLIDERAAEPEAEAEDSEIGALVRRIESFRKSRPTRQPSGDSPRLPLGDRSEPIRAPLAGFAFTTDAEGRIDWAEAGVAPMVVGATLPPARDAARRDRQPLRHFALSWDGAPQVAGQWIVDATPRFTDPGGHFYGYAGRFRRPPETPTVSHPRQGDRSADLMRQLLHELKTPVNAIQGFAEVIQQQLFGPTPHEYRALAAAIAGDAARMLAGFDELDRLAKLESGALALEDGESDFAAILSRLAAQLQEVLRARNAGFVLTLPETGGVKVPIAPTEAEALAWRLLATLTGSIGAGEQIALSLECSNGTATLDCALPAALAARDDVFADGTRASGAVSAGMFGVGFALRLARAEARAAGGDLVSERGQLLLRLPCLTKTKPAPSDIADEAVSG
ncbi:histidine kinase dimerization/phospho-acceptor domain-containing protein [Tsuneonella mangrovi]|uniref:histidine kinase dimerization/phospho-acceptor domain-containing protein n=1 Tax=Tsuneonella mangrovi TaxID=1982042 RepID=UPI000BA2436D|nr:histidine kinase dimerization/phospho-acceptor domain-containing protein [Tsuneonella mangrovi]